MQVYNYRIFQKYQSMCTKIGTLNNCNDNFFFFFNSNWKFVHSDLLAYPSFLSNHPIVSIDLQPLGYRMCARVVLSGGALWIKLSSKLYVCHPIFINLASNTLDC